MTVFYILSGVALLLFIFGIITAGFGSMTISAMEIMLAAAAVVAIAVLRFIKI